LANFYFTVTTSSLAEAVVDYSQPYRQFSVVYARASNRKYKRWEGDGMLTNQKNILVLEDVNNGRKRIAASYRNNKLELEYLGAGNSLIVGGYEVEIQNEVIQPKFGKF
jgi:DNA repair and recombination protein RAD54B